MIRPGRFFGVLLAALVFALIVSPVDAGRKWCQHDPIFTIAGISTPVYVAVYDDMQAHVTGPIAVKLTVPIGTPVEVTFVDEGFNGYGEVISIDSSSRLKVTSRGIQVQVQVTVPADTSMPVLVTVAPSTGRASSVTGKTNTIIVVNVTVPSAG